MKKSRAVIYRRARTGEVIFNGEGWWGIWRAMDKCLFHEYEVYGQNKADERCEVVPVKRFSPEKHHGEDGEYNQSDCFLYDFQLHKRECTAVALESDSVGRHLAGVFQQGDSPRYEDYHIKRSVGGENLHLLKFQMAIPGESHEYVRDYEKSDSKPGIHQRASGLRVLCL